MKYLLPSLLACAVATGIWAQPRPNHQAPDSPVPGEQRRAELRMALKAQSGRDASIRAPILKNDPNARELSASERAALRQQLRQQRLDAKKNP